MLPLRPLLLCAFLAEGGAFLAPAAEEGDEAFFESKVRPLLLARCVECHGPEKQKGGLRLDSRAAWREGGEHGAALVPGDPDHSRLITAVRYQDKDLRMPPKEPLSPAEIAALEEWVRRGAPDPRDGAAKLPSRFDPAEARKIWSFQPIGNSDPPPPLPGVNGGPEAAWQVSGIDRFLLAKLKEKGLAPRPEAPRRALIRRVYFDLTGLPPTPEQADAFEADTSPDAWEKLVDSLLTGQAAAERQARWWLDTARYADTNGQDENKVMSNAWRYRDWVIAAFRNNLPFDEFITEQLAGDLLADTGDAAVHASRLTATGFLVLGPKMLAEQDKEKLVMDIVDEQVDTAGRAFLGLTLGCARCHDHKFDPVTARDYYALAGIFKSTKVMADLAFVSKFNERTAEPPERVTAVKEHAERTAAVEKQLKEATDAATAELTAARRKEFPRLLIAAAAEGAEPGPDAETIGKLRALLEAGHALEPRLRAALSAPMPEQALTELAAAPEISEAVFGKDAPLALPADLRAAYPAETRDRLTALEKERDALAAAIPPPVAMSLAAEDAAPVNLPVMIRGSHLNPGPEAVPRGFIRALMRPGEETSIGIPAEHSGRLELARWLTSPDQPLTARVIVNRVWQQSFGTGIVPSADNFGPRGEPPTHPELLDRLAREFIRSGWDLRALRRRIVLSAAYRQESVPAGNPDARFLAGFPRQRLEAEMIRDALLAVSGTLDRTAGGTLTPEWKNAEYTPGDTVSATSLRRSLYLPVVRDRVNDFLAVFDFANPGVTTARRSSTVVSHQALFFLNSPQVLAAASSLAKDLSTKPPREAVTEAWRKVLCRSPRPDEEEQALHFLESVPAAPETGADSAPAEAKTPPEMSALAALCQTLLSTNEFLYRN